MFDKSIAQQIVNNLYAVFLGFVLSSFFIVEKNTEGQYFVKFFSGVEWIILFLLLLYYMVDWFTTLFLLRNDKEITYYHMFLLLGANLVLCYTILLSINGGFKQFLIFGIYSLVVPLWDMIVTSDELKAITYKNQQKHAEKNKYKFLLGCRFMLGFVLCVPLASLLLKGSTVISDDLLYFVYSLILAIVIIKFIRMQIIFKIYTT